jgi:hypothetical protein
VEAMVNFDTDFSRIVFLMQVINDLPASRSDCTRKLQVAEKRIPEYYKEYLYASNTDWLPTRLDLAGIQLYTDFKDYRGIYQDEAKRMMKYAIRSNAGPGTIQFLLSQPSFADPLHPATTHSYYLATLVNDECSSSNDECQACQGRHGDHTCAGSTIFSQLVRQINCLKKECDRIESIIALLKDESEGEASNSSAGFGFAAYPELMKELSTVLALEQDERERKTDRLAAEDESNNGKEKRLKRDGQEDESAGLKAIFQVTMLVTELKSMLHKYAEEQNIGALKEAMSGDLKVVSKGKPSS